MTETSDNDIDVEALKRLRELMRDFYKRKRAVEIEPNVFILEDE